MLSTVLGLFSQDLAVDLGTSTTRIYQRGTGVVCREPTVVAVHTDRRGRRRVHSLGEAAAPIVGRAPADLAAVMPVREGLVHDREVAEALLLHLVRRVHGRNGWLRPRIVTAVPGRSDAPARAAVRASYVAAGAREVHLVPRPLAAALGAGLSLTGDQPHLVVDMGGGTAEIAALAGRRILDLRTLPGGSQAFDRALAAHLRDRHDLLIGEPTAERLKREVGLDGPARDTRLVVRGRCLKSGRPHRVEVLRGALQDAMGEPVDALATAVRRLLDALPAGPRAALVRQGVVLTGGGALLLGLDRALRMATGLPVVVQPDAADAVVRGAGQLLDDERALSACCA